MERIKKRRYVSAALALMLMGSAIGLSGCKYTKNYKNESVQDTKSSALEGTILENVYLTRDDITYCTDLVNADGYSIISGIKIDSKYRSNISSYLHLSRYFLEDELSNYLSDNLTNEDIAATIYRALRYNESNTFATSIEEVINHWKDSHDESEESIISDKNSILSGTILNGVYVNPLQKDLVLIIDEKNNSFTFKSVITGDVYSIDKEYALLRNINPYLSLDNIYNGLIGTLSNDEIIEICNRAMNETYEIDEALDNLQRTK